MPPALPGRRAAAHHGSRPHHAEVWKFWNLGKAGTLTHTASTPAVPPVLTGADLGSALKRRMRERRTKVATLAREVDVSASTLYAYLAGTTLPPTEVLDALLLALEVSPEEQHRLATARDTLAHGRRRTPDDAATGAVGGATGRAVPQELPQAPSGFVGRADVLARLDAAGADADARVVVLAGTAGVGKTAVAVTWAHTAGARFPDGCLYVDLRGFSPGEPRRPTDVLAGFLRSLGERDVPDDLDDRVRLFRTATAGRRLLLVLDNAVDEAQVRPLLPGHAATYVLVTSRRDLAGLRVEPGAEVVPVATLSTEESSALLAAQLGSGTPDATLARAGERCGGLPLALRLVAARAGAEPGAAEAVVADLRARPGLDAFDVGDEHTSARAVFSWSERHLGHDERRAFHLLGLVPVPDLSVPEAAALWHTDVAGSARLVDRLARAHLVQPTGEGRWGMHDLVGEHARERGRSVLATADQDAALARLVAHVVDAGWDAVPWPNLVGMIDECGSTGRWAQVLSLVRMSLPRLDESGRYADARGLLEHGLVAARALADPVGESACLRGLGAVETRVGRYDEALARFAAAEQISIAGGDVNGRAGCLNNLGNLHERRGEHDLALDCYRRAVPLAEQLGAVAGLATLDNNIGRTLHGLGRYDEALVHLTAARGRYVEAGDQGGIARAEGNLGELHLEAGRTDEAFHHLDQALTVARDIEARSIETEALNALGRAHLHAGDHEAARDAHLAAHELAVEAGAGFDAAVADEGLGHVAAARGEVGLARSHWSRSHARLTALRLPAADRVAVLLEGVPEAEAG